ncbi:MAG TPA: FHA domain-containing protein, partial [Roseiflexaceae bacterium]|nr:FHA domain-containing protein [Roseiflexaceae bacterium]
MAYGTITITYSDGQFVEIPLESPAVTIGRAPDNTIVLDAPGIAAHHARIARTDAGVGLEDYTADGRTRVDGVPLLPGEYHALASGSRIELGSVTISLSLIPPTPAAAPPSDVDLLAALLGTQAAAPQQRGRITRPLGSIAPPVAVEPPAPPAPDSRGARRERTTMPLAPPTIHERPTTPIPTAPPPASPGVAVLPEAPPEASAPPPAPASEQLISISPEDLGAQEVAVEQIATYRITVTNLSRLADGVVIRVEGVPPEWVKITRADGAGWNLLPDQGNTLEAEIAIRPPRAPSSWAGDYDIAVVVGLQVQSEQQRTARGRLTVLPFDDHAVSELDPEVVKDWWRGTYTLTIHNRGNHPQAFTVSADSDDHTLGFRFRQLGVRRMAGDRSKERVVVEPDQQARVRLTVTARGRARRLIGNERTHGFDVDVVPASGPPLPALRGDFIQYPLFRNWIIPLALVTMAGLLIVSCVALAFRELPEICARRPLPVICPAPAVTVAPTAAPTLAPTLAPTAAPTLAPPTEAHPPTLPPPPPTVDVGPTLTAIALVAAQTGTAVAGASDAEKTAAAQTQVALLTAVAQTQVAQLTLVAQTQAAQQTAFAQTQVARETAALQTQVAQETAFAQTQVARETAAAAGARLTETAIARDSFATQTAFAFQLTQTSIAATQTALARPTNTPTPTSTPTNTPTPTPT